jgi:hypothetical protein
LLAVAAAHTLARALIGGLLVSMIACRASAPSDEAVCPADAAAAATTPLLVDFGEPIREQLAACELDRRPWVREAWVEDDVGLELVAEYRETVQHALTGPRRALVVRVLEADRARQIAERLAEADVEVTRVDFGRRPTKAELDVVLQDFALTGEPGLAIVSLDGLANADAGPCLRLADGCVALTWLRDHIHALDSGLRVVTLGGQASVAALRVFADAKTVAVVTSEDGLERYWMARPPGLGEFETFADRAIRVAAMGAPIRLHEPVAGIALGRAEALLPERGRVTLAHAKHDLELTRTMLDDDEPAYFALIPEDCPSCQLFRASYFVLASVDDHRRFWRIAQRDALGIIDANLRGREYRRRNPGFGFRSGADVPEFFEPRIAIATADGRYFPVDEIGVPQASLWRIYGTLGLDAELAHLRAALRPSDDAIELVPILAALARHPDAVADAAAIARLFEHADGRVRLRALDGYVALAGIDATSRCALLAALGDPDRRVRLWARAWIHDPRLDPELLAAGVALSLERSTRVTVPGGTEARQRDLIAVLGELARTEGSATRVLVTLLETPRFAELQGEVSRAIAAVGPGAASAIGALVELVEAAREPNPNVLRALAAIGPDAACVAPRLRATADDPTRPAEARRQIHDTLDAIVATESTKYTNLWGE